MQEMQVQSLSWEDPLKKGMATHSSVLAWKIPWTEESDRLQSMGLKESEMTDHASDLLEVCNTHQILRLSTCMSYYKNYNKFKDLKHPFIITQCYSPEVLVQMAHLRPLLSLLRTKSRCQ